MSARNLDRNQTADVARQDVQRERPPIDWGQVARRTVIGIGLVFVLLAGVWLFFRLLNFE